MIEIYNKIIERHIHETTGAVCQAYTGGPSLEGWKGNSVIIRPGADAQRLLSNGLRFTYSIDPETQEVKCRLSSFVDTVVFTLEPRDPDKRAKFRGPIVGLGYDLLQHVRMADENALLGDEDEGPCSGPSDEVVEEVYTQRIYAHHDHTLRPYEDPINGHTFWMFTVALILDDATRTATPRLLDVPHEFGDAYRLGPGQRAIQIGVGQVHNKRGEGHPDHCKDDPHWHYTIASNAGGRHTDPFEEFFGRSDNDDGIGALARALGLS